MAKNGVLVREIDILLIARRIRFLGIAIFVGIFLIYILGLFVSGSYINKDLGIFNLMSLIVVAVLCFPTFFIKRIFLKKVNSKNFMKSYFNAHLIPFAMCDLGGLFCITTNLFVNQNIIYATIGLIVSLAFLVINFPKFNDYEKLNL
jgi:hypothetical protein